MGNEEEVNLRITDGVNGTFRLVTEKTSRMRGQNLSLFSVEREKARITEKKRR